MDCENGEDANLAGTKDSMRCTLHLVEGLSAANYPQKRICLMEGGKDIFGYLPMRGKVLNVTNAGPIQYAENTVICNIKKMLGLKEDTDYKFGRATYHYLGAILPSTLEWVVFDNKKRTLSDNE